MTEDEKLTEQAKKIIKYSRKNRSNLIPLLQKIQEKLGYLPREAMLAVAEHMSIPPVEVYDVATFYNQFRFSPPGKHSVRVCLGTACHMKGGHLTLEAWQRRLGISAGQTTEDREFDLDTVVCLGCCALAPVNVVDDKLEGQVDATRVDGLLLGLGHEIDKQNK